MNAELANHPLNQVARVLTWGALGLLAYGATSWVVAQPWFALTTLEVKTPVAHVTEEQIRLVAERRVRGTFFTVDLEHVRESLEKLPWVREARVERRWPDTLVVSLVEQVPVARWNDNALVNGEGGVFVAAASDALPRLSGPEESSAEVVAAYQRYQTALKPLDMNIAELRLSPRRAWWIRLDNGMQLVLGREQTDARLARFVSLYPRLMTAQAVTRLVPALDQAPGSALASAVAATVDLKPAASILPLSVDLRYADGFAVRMPNGASPFKPSTS
ncbi:cell division protein FtsQ/DivIB [Thiobacillus sp.]|uniref:cell division protein FtsQ/DivIB n=1 Tax=Thiobacillus sp. TaxID=924 RepID=UPI00286D87B9|nr:cell division protein FtsQ/DivIB [Thiobacillus sp.]